MSSDILKAIKQICSEKNISYESVLETIEAAMAVAYRKEFGLKTQNIKVNFHPETGQSEVYDEKTVVDMATLEPLTDEKSGAEVEAKEDKAEVKLETRQRAPEQSTADASGEEETEKRKFNPKADISLEDALHIKPDAVIGDVIRTKLEVPATFGRMAAQTAKQVIIQKLREAERDQILQEFESRVGEIVSGVVQRVEGKNVLIDISKTVALMPPQEQIPYENYRPGQKLRVYIVSVQKTTKGPEILVSRAHANMVAKLFFTEVPEIESGVIEIKSIAREAGSRTKIAVQSLEDNIDPIGSCVGQRGSRVQTVISELGGEKIDIVEWSDDPVRFIIHALSPAKILSVKLQEKTKTALAEVKEDQLSLAIGKTGQNVRLSSKLTGWKIDIIKEGKPTKVEEVQVKEGRDDEKEK